MSNGFIAPVDPEAWRIVDSKLYLNFDNKIQTKWEEDVQSNIKKGNRNWENVLKK